MKAFLFGLLAIASILAVAVFLLAGMYQFKVGTNALGAAALIAAAFCMWLFAFSLEKLEDDCIPTYK